LQAKGQVAEADGRCGEPVGDLLIAALAIDRIGCLNSTEKLRLFDHTANVNAVSRLTPRAV
jgi:hypothetical protein